MTVAIFRRTNQPQGKRATIIDRRYSPPPPQAVENFSFKMKPPGTDMLIVVTKWYGYAKWVLERVEGFPK